MFDAQISLVFVFFVCIDVNEKARLQKTSFVIRKQLSVSFSRKVWRLIVLWNLFVVVFRYRCQCLFSCLAIRFRSDCPVRVPSVKRGEKRPKQTERVDLMMLLRNCCLVLVWDGGIYLGISGDRAHEMSSSCSVKLTGCHVQRLCSLGSFLFLRLIINPAPNRPCRFISSNYAGFILPVFGEKSSQGFSAFLVVGEIFPLVGNLEVLDGY